MNVVIRFTWGCWFQRESAKITGDVGCRWRSSMASLALVRDDVGGSVEKLDNAFAFARFKTQLD